MSKLDNHEVALAASYLMLGFTSSANYQKALDNWYPRNHGGHIELIDEISKFALEVATVLVEIDKEEFPGVYHYEVTEDFGKWLCQQVEINGEPPSKEVGGVKLREMTRAFLSQGIPTTHYSEVEIRPVLLSGEEDVQFFDTHADAEAERTNAGGTIQWGIYGKQLNGCYQHLADRLDKEDMLQYVRQQFGLDIDWPHLDRITFVPAAV